MKTRVFFCACCLVTFSLLTGVKLFPFANGRSYPWTNASLRSVFMLDGSNVWVVGQSGTILRWEGLAWRTVASPTGSWLQSVYMNNAIDGWAVGQSTIMHWNGTVWEAVPNPTGENLYDIFMVNANEGWTVGNAGRTIHWNGTTWTAKPSPTSELLFSIYMTDSSDAWAVGSRGTIINWNGTAWNNVTSPITTSLYDVAMVTASDGWGVGNGGTIIHYNGTSWNNVSSPTSDGLRSVYMVNSTEGWAVGDAGSVIRWNGTAWNTEPSPTSGWFFSVFMIDEDDGWAVGDFGAIIRWNGVEWLESSTSIHQGDLIVNGDDVFVIEDERFEINGSIIIEENATLILENAIVNFTRGALTGIYLQHPANGNPRLRANNTTITRNPYCRFYGNSSIVFSNCSINAAIHFDDESSGTISGSTLSSMQARGASTVSVSDSVIAYFDLVTTSANSSISDLAPGLFDFWDFWLNCSVVVDPAGRAPHVTLTQTTVDHWSFSFQGASNARIRGSQIFSLHANGLSHASAYNCTIYSVDLYNSVLVELTNSTLSLHNLHNQATVCVRWYLDVHVADSTGQDVPSANVTAFFPNATVAESKLTGAHGWSRLTLTEKMMNLTDEYPVGNYTIEATYDIHSDDLTVNMTESQQIALTLEDFVIPEFALFITLPLFLIATLLAAMISRRKQLPKSS